MNNREEIFRKLVEQQKDRIRSVCSHFAGNKADQDDLYQEILINTWKGLDSFRGDAKPGTWMYRIAVNTALGFAGKIKKRMQVSISLDQSNLGFFSEGESSFDAAEKEEVISELESRINQLAVIDKILVSLMLEELSYREIADIIGITEPNVRVKIHRIKEFLRITMKGNNHENNE